MAYLAHKGKSRTPTILPSFDVAGRAVERIVPPGERLGVGLENGLGGEGMGFTTCDCDGCKALYAQETAA